MGQICSFLNLCLKELCEYIGMKGEGERDRFQPVGIACCCALLSLNLEKQCAKEDRKLTSFNYWAGEERKEPA